VELVANAQADRYTLTAEYFTNSINRSVCRAHQGECAQGSDRGDAAGIDPKYFGVRKFREYT